MKFNFKNLLLRLFLGILFFSFFSLKPVLADVGNECYNLGSGGVLKDFFNYVFTAGHCRGPLSANGSVMARFNGLPFYEWTDPGCVKNNISFKDTLNCGDKNYPCYCDSKSGNPDYRCGKIKGAAYIDRPYYYIYHDDGDFEIKGNLGSTGNTTYCLGRGMNIRGAGGGFISFAKDKLDALLGKIAVFRRGLVFNNNSGSLQLGGGTEVSKVKRGKIVVTNLAGRKEGVDGASWEELSPGDWGIDYYKNIVSIAEQGGYFYLADKDGRRVIRTDGENAAILGDSGWGWMPEDIAVDQDSVIYVASSLNEYDSEGLSAFSLVNPAANSVYYAGDPVTISWNSFPGANKYKLVFKDGESAAEIITENTSAQTRLKTKGSYAFKVLALYNNKIMAETANTLVIHAISKGEQVFRLKSPEENSVFKPGETVAFSWDKYKGNFADLNYKLAIKKDGQNAADISVKKGADYHELELAGENIAGDYEYTLKAFNKNTLISSTNAVRFSVAKNSKADNLALGGNIFKTKIDGDGWQQFIPNKRDKKAVRRFNALKEYLTAANGDPRALSFNKPSGLALAGDFIYIADSGNGRIVRLGKSISIPKDLGDYLVDLKTNNGEDWHTKISASRKTEAENYWKIFDIGGMILKDPADILNVGGQFYIADTGNKRVVFQKGAEWKSIGGEGFNWEPKRTYVKDERLFVLDSLNGRIVKIDISNGCNSYFSKGLSLRESYFIFGRRGGEKMEWSYPADMLFKSGNFYVADSVGDSGYSFIAGGKNILSLYALPGNQDILNSGGDNPFNAEILASTTIAKALSVAGLAEPFNGEKDHFIEWTRGEGISHCPTISSCATTTCLGQWDWDSNAGNCYYYTEGCCKYSSSTPAVCLSTGCCEVKNENCHVGYSVSFKDYIKPYKEQDLSDDLIYGWMASSTKDTCD